MKRLLKLTALLGIVGTASWGGATLPAFAYPLCNGLHGTSCSPTGGTTNCTTSDGFTSSCTCTSGHLWRCKL
ncbi:MAG TPA: hypothetical protein VLB76_00220 [Thermoanaerobaculia bacterium]|jgi:hypothetical protein|nr:hypothetical protein [Thermoanaerobaculia bacterium]